MTNTMFGLTTAKDRDYWKNLLYETNDAIERFQIENKALKKDLEKLTAKHEALKQDLKDKEAWVNHLEETNKEQAELIAKQINSINQALEESARNAMLYNEATVKLAQQKTAIRIAIENFNLATKDI